MIIRASGMIAREDALDEGPVNRTPVLLEKLGKPFLALGKRRAALACPHVRIQRQARHAFGMPLREKSGLQGAG
ncbi:hypothetical protein D3C71_2110110 [compost metagenome]